MEHNVKGFVQQVAGQLTTREWLDKHLIASDFKSTGAKVKMTWGRNKRDIKDFEACHVFTPRLAKGQNGVMLVEYLGIGDIADLNIQIADEGGFQQDIVWYPLCPPTNSSVILEEACAMQIGQQWRRYNTVKRETKWGLVGTFNVMQFFFYHSSQAFDTPAKKDLAIKYLDYLKSIFSQTLPKLIANDASGEVKQILYSCANSLDSHDVLHTALSLGVVDRYMPNEARSINRAQIYESLIRKNLERMTRYSNPSFNRDTDMASFTGHYPLILFSPICIAYLIDEIPTAQKAIDQYIDLIGNLKNEMKRHGLRKGVQQFRLIMLRSGLLKHVNQDSGAAIWVRVLGGGDIKLPKEVLNDIPKIEIGKRKARDDDIKMLSPEEEKKGGAGEEKRPRFEDEPSYQFTAPFKLYSRLVNSTVTTKSTFGTNFANIVLPEEGFYQINLQSTLNSIFYGKQMYKDSSCLISNFRVGFAVLSNSGQDYFHCQDEDTYSVSGVWYKSDSHSYNQINPLKFLSTQAIDFQIIYLNNTVYVRAKPQEQEECWEDTQDVFARDELHSSHLEV
ncbi:hypothetical protein FGO68_gene7848 [Halteria grandinella]|uniref:Uncharacterized protein n=1 Tax=Halteria grandinella TaxID=5974 RepID=A0A8J8NW92_HALGN|nr:hypothetical protein FGO68_gene7848 [Halteria grandinella]